MNKNIFKRIKTLNINSISMQINGNSLYTKVNDKVEVRTDNYNSVVFVRDYEIIAKFYIINVCNIKRTGKVIRIEFKDGMIQYIILK